MQRYIILNIEKLPEGYYLATSNDIQGLVAQGKTVEETIEIARDIAGNLLELQKKRKNKKLAVNTSERMIYPMLVTA